MNILGGSQNAHVQHLNAYHVEGGLHLHPGQFSAADQSLHELLQPIEDASHTRDRKRSPPNSACARGTRIEVVEKVTTWTGSDVLDTDEPHILWMHGYVGSGKSAISQEVCDLSERQDKPVVSFFFFRNAGDRSKIWRLATTLASQMAAVIPETESFIRAAVKDNPALLRPDEGGVSLRSRMHHLVYAPFKAAVQARTRVRASADGSPGVTQTQRLTLQEATPGPSTVPALAGGPFLIVLDGLDECDNKDEVQELIDGTLTFFDDNPFIPLRIFITSRVEQHIQSHLNVPGVRLENLVDHCSDDDISTFLDVLFEHEKRRNPVVRAYILEHGEWPAPSDKRKLIEHIGGSFIFASTVFRFIMESTADGGSPTTPMGRLPLALKMNPGLDGLYTQTLARSENLPHFLVILSTITLLERPLPMSGIAELLGLSTYEVINVLVNLQAIIQVPGTDDMPVTLFHTSLRDFLTTQSRSGRFLAHPHHHVHLYLRCVHCILVHHRRNPGASISSSEPTPAGAYATRHHINHLIAGEALFQLPEIDSAIQTYIQTLDLHPGTFHLIHSLATVTHYRARRTGSLIDFDAAISMYRELEGLLGSVNRLEVLTDLGYILFDRYQRTKIKIVADLEEAVSLFREKLEHLSSPDINRTPTLIYLGDALLEHHQHSGSMADLEQAISLLREALGNLSSQHQHRSRTLDLLGIALRYRHESTGAVADLKGAISFHREALEMCPFPDPYRPFPLFGLAICLGKVYNETRALPHLQEAISHLEELLETHDLVRDPDRLEILRRLAPLLQMRSDATGQTEDLARIARLNAEASQLERELGVLRLKVGETEGEEVEEEEEAEDEGGEDGGEGKEEGVGGEGEGDLREGEDAEGDEAEVKEEPEEEEFAYGAFGAEDDEEEVDQLDEDEEEYDTWRGCVVGSSDI